MTRLALILLLHLVQPQGHECSASERPALVTLVIPTNGRATLNRTLESLQNQTDPAWRAVIVVDGAATQAARLETVQDARFTVTHTGKKLGTGVNSAGEVRNVGLRLVRTPWTGFVDDDDTLSPTYVAALRSDSDHHPSVKTVVFRMYRADKGVLPSYKDQTLRLRHVGISFAVQTDFLQAHALSFRPSMTEDFDLLQRIHQLSDSMLMSSHTSYYVRMKPPEHLVRQGDPMPSPAADDSSEEDDGGIPTGAVVGIAVGVTALVVVFFFMSPTARSRVKRWTKSKEEKVQVCSISIA